QTTLDGLAALKPSFLPNGKIHAGNSSGIVDGASGVLLASKRAVKDLGLKPRARVVDTVIVGSEPVIMLTGPIPATQKILRRRGTAARARGARDRGGPHPVPPPSRHRRAHTRSMIPAVGEGAMCRSGAGCAMGREARARGGRGPAAISRTGRSARS